MVISIQLFFENCVKNLVENFVKNLKKNEGENLEKLRENTEKNVGEIQEKLSEKIQRKPVENCCKNFGESVIRILEQAFELIRENYTAKISIFIMKQ